MSRRRAIALVVATVCSVAAGGASASPAAPADDPTTSTIPAPLVPAATRACAVLGYAGEASAHPDLDVQTILVPTVGPVLTACASMTPRPGPTSCPSDGAAAPPDGGPPPLAPVGGVVDTVDASAQAGGADGSSGAALRDLLGCGLATPVGEEEAAPTPPPAASPTAEVRPPVPIPTPPTRAVAAARPPGSTNPVPGVAPRAPAGIPGAVLAAALHLDGSARAILTGLLLALALVAWARSKLRVLPA